jgi:aerobic-type carbon monoxide dehydrogenase small subunit (CoxS/CutS family)
MILRLAVNDRQRELEIRPGQILLDVLRDAGYCGVKRGCETGTCGSCVILLDGEPHYSCLLLAASVEGRRVTTIEALGTPDEPHPIMRAFAEEGGVQCGYCVPGMVLTAKALLDRNPSPTEEEARRALDGHLCRCTGYVKQIRAVLRASELLGEEAS